MKDSRKLIAGIDEVGRGPWAGPVVSCAVVLDKPIDGLKDSKLLSPKKREALNEIIHKQATAIGIGWVSASEIDETGLTEAVRKSMNLAYGQLDISPDEIIIDGNINYLPEAPNSRAVIKADSKFPEVAAASIVAKVARDKYMAEAVSEYPGYGFENHKGYGTAEHKQALEKLGPCPLHRRSFKPVAKLI